MPATAKGTAWDQTPGGQPGLMEGNNTVAQPAHRPLPDDFARKEVNRRARGWAHVQAAMITAAQSVAAAATELGGRPADGAAQAMLQLCLGVLQELGEVTRGCSYEEELYEAEVQRRIDEALAAHGITRRLAAVPDPD